MKRCPACNQTYADELSFCTVDGTVLASTTPSPYDPQATIMSPQPPVTQEPPSFGSVGPADWNMPGSYSPPQTWNAPGGWQQPVQETPPGMVQARAPQPQQGLAIASLICGIISITFGLICGGPVMAFAALVLGIVALVQIKNDPRRFSGKVLAIIGTAIGALRLIFSLLFLLIMIAGSLSH
jgi:hypothetical protein